MKSQKTTIKKLRKNITKQINESNGVLRHHKNKKFYYHFHGKTFKVNHEKIKGIVYGFIFYKQYLYLNVGCEKPLKKFKLEQLENIQIEECVDVKIEKEYLKIKGFMF